MGTSENPLSRPYWLGVVDPRPLAVFRVGFGLTLLQDLRDLTENFRAFLTDDGMLPRGVEHVPFGWSVFDLVGSPFAVGVVFALGVLAVTAFTVGFQTRIATIASWLFLASLHNRNPFITDGGDDLARILMFWAIFGELGECYSVDALLRKAPARPVPAIGLRVLQWHIIVLYTVTGILKLRQGWLHGEAIYQALQLRGFLRPPGALLGQSALLCKLSTWAVLAMELTFPIGAASPFFVPRARALAIACGLGVQLGIFAAMRVGVFTQTMLWAMVLFAQPGWMDRAEAFVGRRLGRKTSGFAAADLDGAPTSPGRTALGLLVGLQFLVTAWDPFLNNRLPLPRLVKDERRLLQLQQPMDLFGGVNEIPSWSAAGRLEDGTPVNVLALVATGTHEEPRFHYSRWNKFTFKWAERPYRLPELGAYFCRAYDESTGQRLASFTLVNDPRMPTKPGGAAPPPTHKVILDYDCRTGNE